MPTPPISATGLRMPDDFEYAPYEAVYQRISPLNERYPTRWIEWSTSWVGVAYRFRACAEYSEAFTRSIKKHAAPQEPERYCQERDLFGFFVNGLSAIENTCYGLFAMASMLNPTGFPLHETDLPRETLEKKRKRNPTKEIDPKTDINPKYTAKKFSEEFKGDAITNTLDELVNSKMFEKWGRARNIPAHRQSPGRIIHATLGSGSRPMTAISTSGIPLNASTTTRRRIWLAEIIRRLLRGAEAFTNSHHF